MLLQTLDVEIEMKNLKSSSNVTVVQQLWECRSHPTTPLDSLLQLPGAVITVLRVH